MSSSNGGSLLLVPVEFRDVFFLGLGGLGGLGGLVLFSRGLPPPGLDRPRPRPPGSSSSPLWLSSSSGRCLCSCCWFWFWWWWCCCCSCFELARLSLCANILCARSRLLLRWFLCFTSICSISRLPPPFSVYLYVYIYICKYIFSSIRLYSCVFIWCIYVCAYIRKYIGSEFVSYELEPGDRAEESSNFITVKRLRREERTKTRRRLNSEFQSCIIKEEASRRSCFPYASVYISLSFL